MGWRTTEGGLLVPDGNDGPADGLARYPDGQPQASLAGCPYGICSSCGCADDNACADEDGLPCWWVDDEHTLCSGCA
jgi:hypothetical protein